MSTKHLSQLPQLFRSPFLRKIAIGNYYPELVERLKIAGLDELLKLRLGDIFEGVYEILLKNYRCEYVFKNALTENWLLSRHSVEQSFITDEFRVGGCRVDLAIFSKTSIGFEIKTEFDSPARLHCQSQACVKMFDLVYLVTTETMLPKLDDSIPKSVGVLTLNKNGGFKTVRPSQSHSNLLDLATAFDCLRQPERLAIVEKFSSQKIDVPNSEIYEASKRVFRKLLPFEAHTLIVQQIRNRDYSKTSRALMVSVPNALKHLALTLRATNKEMSRIIEELKMIPRDKNKKKEQHYESIFPIFEGETERVAGT